MKRIKIRWNVIYFITIGIGLLVFMSWTGAMSGEPLSNGVSFMLGVIATLSKDILRMDRTSPFEEAKELTSAPECEVCKARQAEEEDD